jgi:hypothetical protein
MKTYDMTEQAYRNGYEKGFEAGKRAAAKAASGVSTVSDATLYALYKMDQKTHPVDEGRSCVNCMDGGIDSPHCSECNPANGFAYFRRRGLNK